jgi:hypothetical protein
MMSFEMGWALKIGVKSKVALPEAVARVVL